MKHRHMRMLLPGLLGAAILLTSGQASAQYRRGYIPHHPPPLDWKWRVHAYAGAELVGFVVLGQQIENFGTLGHGGGFGLYGGVRLGRWAAIEANWHFTVHSEFYNDERFVVEEVNSHQLQTLTGDFKLHIPTWSRVEPFIQAGGGWAFFGLTGNGDGGYLYKNGPMFNVGGGFNAWLNPWFTLGARILYQGIWLDDSRYDLRVTENGSTGRRGSPSNWINGLSIAGSAAFHF